VIDQENAACEETIEKRSESGARACKKRSEPNTVKSCSNVGVNEKRAVTHFQDSIFNDLLISSSPVTVAVTTTIGVTVAVTFTIGVSAAVTGVALFITIATTTPVPAVVDIVVVVVVVVVVNAIVTVTVVIIVVVIVAIVVVVDRS
jgi:hypothetical protein